MIATSIYWVSTSLLLLLYAVSALSYITKPEWAAGEIAKLGFPRYLIWPLTVVKLLAIAAILSRVSVALSDFAYAGVVIHLLLSAGAHIGVRKPMGALPALVGLLFALASFTTQNLARTTSSAYAPSSFAHIAGGAP